MVKGRSANAELPVRNAEQLAALRVVHAVSAPARSGRYVLYWLQQFRRLRYNRALDRAVALARTRELPLLVFEDLRCDKAWAADRHHAFAAAGMREHAARCERAGVGYLPLVETAPGQVEAILTDLVTDAAVVVADDAPTAVVVAHNALLVRLAGPRGCPVELIDDNGLVPTRLLVAACPSAAVFRRYLHKHAHAALADLPAASPLAGHGLRRFPPTRLRRLLQDHPAGRWLQRYGRRPAAALAELPIDHAVPPVPDRGGRQAGLRELRCFLARGLTAYGERKHPDEDVASGLSPYLHWGHLAPVEILLRICEQDPAWDPGRIPERGGAREGFWPLAPAAQAFCDQLLTWRELGYHAWTLDADFTSYGSLPGWALATLARHAADERPAGHDLDALTAAETDDELWNAAQRQLRREGTIHNYLRMLWGKRVIEWTAEPEEAYGYLVELNNRWALDGRNPNSWSGIRWCFGCFDHPWAERPIYGTVRYMSSAAARRKLRLGRYLERFGPVGDRGLPA